MMQTTDDTTGPTIDWRDWIAFLGYVLAAAVVISVALASVVLIVSTQADDALPLSDVSSAGPVVAPALIAPLAPAPRSTDVAATRAQASSPAAPGSTLDARPNPATAAANSAAPISASPAIPVRDSLTTAAVPVVASPAVPAAPVAAPISASVATHAVAASGPAVSFAAAADRDPRSPPTGAPQQ